MITTNNIQSVSSFNSRLREEATRQLHGSVLPRAGFNSRLREEATQPVWSFGNTLTCFNSRLREEATSHGSPSRPAEKVSTHASVRRRPEVRMIKRNISKFQLTPP